MRIIYWYATCKISCMITPRFERGFPDNWIQLRDNWNTYARKQEEVPPIIPELEQPFNRTPAEGLVDTSTPYKATAPGARNRRESGFQQAQLAAILEGRENAGSAKVAPRRRSERSSQGPRAATKRRRSPSVPTRKSPRLEKQVEGDGHSEQESRQMKEMCSKSKEVAAGVKVNGQQSSLQCTKCQFETQSKRNFERHMGSKNHKNKATSEVAVPAEVDSGTQSTKVVDEAGKTADSSARAKSSCGKSVPEEERESVAASNSSAGATVSQEETAVATLSRLNTSRASAREARTRCASMLNE